MGILPLSDGMYQMSLLCSQRSSTTHRGEQDGQTLHGGGRTDRGGTGRRAGRLSQIGSSRRAITAGSYTNSTSQTCERGNWSWYSINRLEHSSWFWGRTTPGLRRGTVKRLTGLLEVLKWEVGSIPNNGDTSRGSCALHSGRVPDLWSLAGPPPRASGRRWPAP